METCTVDTNDNKTKKNSRERVRSLCCFLRLVATVWKVGLDNLCQSGLEVRARFNLVSRRLESERVRLEWQRGRAESVEGERADSSSQTQ